MITTHDVFLLIQYYFRSGHIIAGCSPPLPAARRSLVKAVVLKNSRMQLVSCYRIQNHCIL